MEQNPCWLTQLPAGSSSLMTTTWMRVGGQSEQPSSPPPPPNHHLHILPGVLPTPVALGSEPASGRKFTFSDSVLSVLDHRTQIYCKVTRQIKEECVMLQTPLTHPAFTLLRLHVIVMN